MLCLDAVYRSGLTLQGLRHSLDRFAVYDPPVIVLEGFVALGGYPFGSEGALPGRQLGGQLIKWLADEGLDLPVTAHHEPQYRGLYPTHAQHACMTACPSLDGIEPRQVQAIEPVGTATPQGGIAQPGVSGIIFQFAQRALHRHGVKVTDQQALDWHLDADLRQDFIHEQLPLPVRVAGMDNQGGLARKFRDGLIQVLRARSDLQLPVGRYDRQIRDLPALILGVIILRHIGRQDMAGTPDHDIGLATLDVGLVALLRSRQHRRDSTGDGGLFSDEDAHPDLVVLGAESALRGLL